MFEFLQRLAGFTVPIFVIATMLNVGLTQKPSDIVRYWKEWPFVLKMLLANFVLAPLVMVLATNFFTFDPALEAGLLIFALCAGAPFLIKLTQASEHDIALGAATMLLLMVGTVIYAPLVLPLVLEGVSVDAWAVARALFLQLLLPIAVGMLLVQFLEGFAGAIQPWAAKIGNYALYVVLGATLIGYLPNMLNIVGTGAILLGVVFVLVAFGIGYVLGKGEDHTEDVGGLGTAQRNTAAGLIIATQNFTDPNVLVILTLANTIGIVMLLFLARRLSRDNEGQTEKA
ncbi:bile acid:sodium symporter family protein [Deinococcus budaensis]|uniref:BASS family bile acid:Na+ symporter n=1 Tax=Deinococcus budaensis TaxID=1665626 RepID=A0A7W8GFI0_9DEIO|nr:bile acid:sodium symporter [Deinococcus budaensis]MBB5234642.1 BASS family bile acid:Na+ symporter [Deinococcus budaensis]